MSKHNDAKKTEAVEVNGEVAAPTDKRAGWARVQTDRGVYSGERGKGTAVCGLLLGVLDMPPVLGKPWQALVVRLTETCKAKRNEAEYLAEAGEEILVPVNHQLRQHLVRAASHPTAICEVHLQPAGTRKTPAGSMTLWEISVNPQLQKRAPADRLLAMQAAAPAVSQPGAVGQGSDAADDIPF